MSFRISEDRGRVEPMCDLCGRTGRELDRMVEVRRGELHICDECVGELARALGEGAEVGR